MARRARARDPDPGRVRRRAHGDDQARAPRHAHHRAAHRRPLRRGRIRRRERARRRLRRVRRLARRQHDGRRADPDAARRHRTRPVPVRHLHRDARARRRGRQLPLRRLLAAPALAPAKPGRQAVGRGPGRDSARPAREHRLPGRADPPGRPGWSRTRFPESAPERIAMLRLDTDWYASTKHELEQLYPRLVERRRPDRRRLRALRGRPPCGRRVPRRRRRAAAAEPDRLHGRASRSSRREATA